MCNNSPLWINSPSDISPYVGFIYKITCPATGHFYVGRKNFFSVKTLPPLKGMKRKRKKITESDWKTYTSSSVELNEMIQRLGINEFQFEILRLCKTKSEMSYFEVFHILSSESMISPLGLNYQCSKIPCKPKLT